MADGHEPPSLSLQMPHKHKASCHGAIGELQCGFDKYGNSEDEIAELRRQLHSRSVTVLPNDMGLKFTSSNRLDGPWLRALRVITYLVAIVTCLAVLLAMFDVYHLLSVMKHAVETWEDGITTPGQLGD